MALSHMTSISHFISDFDRIIEPINKDELANCICETEFLTVNPVLLVSQDDEAK
jgi:hypothetical protein